jgi:hypothetical protein
MGENGRSDLRITVRIVWGVFLVGFGGFLLFFFRQQASLSFRIPLLCIVATYLGMGVVLLIRRQEWRSGWRMCLGILTGLGVWSALVLCAMVLMACFPYSPYSHDFFWPKDIVPVLIGASLAGYISRKLGTVCGSAIGVGHQLYFVYWLQAATWPAQVPIMKIIEMHRLFPSILVQMLIVLIIGMASGYLGQFLAHRVLRHRDSLDRETSSATGEA